MADCALLKQTKLPIAVEGDYRPILVVPPEIRNLDPAWKTCDLGLYLDDPPQALNPVDSIIDSHPTGPAQLYTTTPRPAPNPAASAAMPVRTPMGTSPNGNGNKGGPLQEAPGRSGSSPAREEDQVLPSSTRADSTTPKRDTPEPKRPTELVFTIGSMRYTATVDGNRVILGGSTIQLGGTALTIPGNLVVSAAPSGLVVTGRATSITKPWTEHETVSRPSTGSGNPSSARKTLSSSAKGNGSKTSLGHYGMLCGVLIICGILIWF